eukprot:SAG22_NODE_13919_length_391_cov_0.517123_1_plen_64_part_10
MTKKILIILIIGLIAIISCKEEKKSQISDAEIWKLGWRMIASSMDENYELANQQFDSLANFSDQ